MLLSDVITDFGFVCGSSTNSLCTKRETLHDDGIRGGTTKRGNEERFERRVVLKVARSLEQHQEISLSANTKNLSISWPPIVTSLMKISTASALNSNCKALEFRFD